MRHMFPVFFALTACGTEADSIPTPDPVHPTLDLTMTGGLTEKDHVEVAPGVFMSAELEASGEVKYHDLGLRPESMLDPEDMFGLAEAEPSSIIGGGGYSYCYNYGTDYGSDTTRYGDLFGGNTSWYNYVSAYSYDYEAPGAGYDYHYDSVSTYVSTEAGAYVNYVYAYAYIYINGRYAGYAQQYATPGRSAYAYGYWEAMCRGGVLEVDAYTYNSAYNYDGQSISVGDRLSTTVTCCPD